MMYKTRYVFLLIFYKVFNPLKFRCFISCNMVVENGIFEISFCKTKKIN